MRPEQLKGAQRIHLATHTSPGMDRIVLAALHDARRPSPWLRPALGVALGAAVLALTVTWFMLRARNSGKQTVVQPQITSPRTTPGLADSMAAPGVMKAVPHPPTRSAPAMKSTGRPAPLPLLATNTEPLTLQGPKRSFRLLKGVEAEIISESAVLKRVGAGHVLLLEGTARFIVSPLPAGETFMVEAGGARVEVLGTVFTVALSSARLDVSLQRGSIRFIWPGGKSTIMKPGGALSMDRQRPRALSRATVRKTLADLRSRGRHAEAATYIIRVLPMIRSGGLKRSLLFDLASIKGEYLHDFTAACSILRRFRKSYPMSPQSQMADLLWTKYRCN